MTVTQIEIAVIGGLGSLVMYLSKLEISKMNTAIGKLSDSLSALSKDFYKLQGEHQERCKYNLA
jgi:hypothetical protein